MKRWFIIGALGLIVIMLVALAFFRKNQPTAGNGPTTQTKTVQPVFPSLPVAQPSYTLSLPAPSFPSSLQNYQTGGPAAGYANKFPDIAKSLGFSGKANILVISRGNFSIWNQGKSSLSLGGDPLEISYNSGLSAAGALSRPVDELEQIARLFVQKAGLNSSVSSLVRESVDYFSPKGSLLNPQPNSNGATLAQINFRHTIDSHPLYTRQANTPSVSVTINSSGQVVSLSGNWFPVFTKTQGLTNLLDYQASQSRLTSGRGVMVSLSSPQDFNTESAPQYNVTTSSVSDVVLGYYYTPGGQTLAPVYVFSGTGTDINTSASVSTITLVSALP